MNEAIAAATKAGLYTAEQIEATRQISERAENIYDCKGIQVKFSRNISTIKLDRVFGEPNLEDAIALKEYAEACGFEKSWLRSSHSIKFVAPRAEKV